MQEKTRDRIIYLTLALGVVFLRVFYISRVRGPFVWTDELGYWGHAANLTGNSWAGVMNGMPWYAFGYSLFLAPIFFLTNDIVLMGRLAVLLNAAFSVASFFLAVQVVRRLVDTKKAIVIGLTAFAATSFSAAIFQSYITWGETLLTLLAWLLLYSLLRLEEEPSFGKSLIAGLLTGYAYMVHNRMLAVVGAVFLTLIVLLILKKLQVRHLAGFLLTFAAAFLAYTLLKRGLRSLILEDAALREFGVETAIGKANTLAGQVKKIGNLFTAAGFLHFMSNFAGQIWHFLSSAYLLTGFGVILCIGRLSAILRKQEEGVVSLWLLPLFMIGATMAMTALFFEEKAVGSGSVRIDTFFYGRYNDVLIPFFVAAGLCFLARLIWEEKRQRISLIVCGCVYLAASACVYAQVGSIENFYLNTVSAASIYIFHWLGGFAVWKCVLLATGVGVLMVAAAVLLKNKRFAEVGYGAICLVVSLLFAATAFFCMRTVIRGETDYIATHASLYEYLNAHAGRGDKVYTLTEDKPAYDLQSRLVDKQVIPVEASVAAQIPNGSYLFLATEDIALLEEGGWESCAEAADYTVVQKTGQAVQ